jgi:hypothetical protein
MQKESALWKKLAPGRRVTGWPPAFMRSQSISFSSAVVAP